MGSDDCRSATYKKSSVPLLKNMFSINWWRDQNTMNFMLESQLALADRMGIYLEE